MAMAYSTSPSSCMHLQALIISIGLLLGLASMSMLVAGSAEEAPSSGYRVELIHVDANAGFTREELISRAVDRAHLREAMLSAATDGTTTTKVVEARTFSHYEYLVELVVGTKTFLVVADTGSDVVWMKQQTPSTIQRVPCNCAKTKKTKDASGQPEKDVSTKSECCGSKLFIFNKKYGHGKKGAKGYMCHEEVTLSPVMTDTGISLGFAIDYDDHLLPGSADGIVGLSRGKMSLLAQLKVTNFSYCLSNPLLKPERKSLFWFGGDDPSLDDSTWQSTPLVPMPIPNDRYHVALLGISIDDDSGGYEKLPKKDFQHKTKEDDVAMFIDSGCSHTFLETPFFGELKRLLDQELGQPELIPKDDKVHTCFPDTTSKRPALALHFKGGARMRIPWDNYMVWDKPESKFCLTINQTAEESIMGNILQHDIRMLFDLKQGKLSFKPVTDCSMQL